MKNKCECTIDIYTYMNTRWVASATLKKNERKKNDMVRDGLANLTTVHNTQSINQLAKQKKYRKEAKEH